MASVARKTVLSFQKLFLFLTTQHLENREPPIVDSINTSQEYLSERFSSLDYFYIVSP
jgi:hypothetical protein